MTSLITLTYILKTILTPMNLISNSLQICSAKNKHIYLFLIWNGCPLTFPLIPPVGSYSPVKEITRGLTLGIYMCDFLFHVRIEILVLLHSPANIVYMHTYSYNQNENPFSSYSQNLVCSNKNFRRFRFYIVHMK